MFGVCFSWLGEDIESDSDLDVSPRKKSKKHNNNNNNNNVKDESSEV